MITTYEYLGGVITNDDQVDLVVQNKAKKALHKTVFRRRKIKVNWKYKKRLQNKNLLH